MVASSARIEEAGNPLYQRDHMQKIFREGMSFSGYERDGLYLALGAGRFRDISGVSGIDSITDGRGSIFGDLDNDGDLDVAVTTIQRTARLLYRNNVGQDHHFLRISLQGTRSGRDAFGAVVRVRSALGTQTKIKPGGSGFLSGHDPRLLFGLGKEKRVEWLEVAWPSGERQRFTGASAGDSLLVVEGAAAPVRLSERRFRLVDPEEIDVAALRSLALEKGQRVPAIALADPAGAATDLSRVLRPGRRTLVNFWATWCVPCRHEMRELQALWPRLKAAGIDLVGVSLDFGESERVRAFLREHGIRYPIYLATESAMERLAKGDGLGVPFTLILDGNGALEGALSGWSAQTRERLEKMTKGKAGAGR